MASPSEIHPRLSLTTPLTLSRARRSLSPPPPQIRYLLKNKQWETRVAAARTISHVCSGISHATVEDVAKLEGTTADAARADAANLPKPSSGGSENADAGEAADLTFDEFDIVGVLERAAPLLANKVDALDAAAFRRVLFHTGSHTTPLARCTPFLKDFTSRRRISPRITARFQSRHTATPFNSQV